MNSILPEYEVKELPSRFAGYPEGTKVYAKPYTYGSALNIELVGKNNINTMKEILSGIKTEGMPKNLLTPQDILFLGVFRNLMSSMHDKISIESYCPKCLHLNKTVASLKDIKFKEIEDFDASVYPLEVDFNDYTMWFGFVSYKDFDFCLKRYRGHKMYQLSLQVLQYKNKQTEELIKKPNFNANTNDKKDTALIEMYVEKVRTILYNLVDEDKDTLEEVCRILEDYGLKPLEVQCEDPLCGDKYTVDFNDDNVLVLPFRETQQSPRNRIKLRKNDISESDTLETDEFEGSGVAPEPNTKTVSKKSKSRAVHLNDEPQIQIFDEQTN